MQCLLNRTTERNGRPCDETTDELTSELATCERIQVDESIDHLRINYRLVPPEPPLCAMPPWEIVPAIHPWPGRCIPQPPHIPCSSSFITQEYTDLWEPPIAPFLLSEPPLPPFPEPSYHCEDKSHCNPRPECEACIPVPPLAICYSIFGHSSSSSWMIYPSAEHECATATRQQLMIGEFDAHGDGHFSFHSPWETVVLLNGNGQDASTGEVDVGPHVFNYLFNLCPVVRYIRGETVHSVYKRKTAIPNSLDPYRLFFYEWAEADNVLHTDFDIYDSEEDARAEAGAWSWCNFDDWDVGYPRDCGKNGRVNYEWFSMPEGSPPFGDHNYGPTRTFSRGLTNGVQFQVYAGHDCPASQWTISHD